MDTTLTCAQCGGDLALGDGFCAYCGVVVFRCPECAAPVLPGTTSCPRCQAAIDPSTPPPRLAFQPAAENSLWQEMVERLRRATLGEFEIERELGRGGMAAVFLAHEIALDRQVAIKVMSPGLLFGEGMVDRFRHEAITIAHLHHPNIVSVYSVRQQEELHFFVMQYVQGRSLEQVIRQAGKLPLPVVRSILHQVGSALAYAHRRRVIHRDVKPGNILIDGEGNAIVTDFGIAKVAESPSQTITGVLVGTPAYMSPEQCRGAEVSGASDQYALGAVAYEMLTGKPPFSGSTYTVLQAHVERPPPPLLEQLADCPPEIEATILRMLAKDPAARFSRIGDAVASLGAEPLKDDDPLRRVLTELHPAPDVAPSRTPPSSASGEVHDTVGSVAILPPPADLEVGDSFALVALVRGQHGNRLPPGKVTWSTDPAGVLELDGGGGTAVAIGEGSTLLTATCQDVPAALSVQVTSPRADEIIIDPPEHGVRAGDEIHVVASALDKRGRPIARQVLWETSDPVTATVTEHGVFLAKAPGLARLTAVLDDIRSTIVVPILPARVAAIRMDDPPPAAAGGTLTVRAMPVDRWGAPLSDRTVLWSSSDVKRAVVAPGGKVHALRPGPVVLTASCEGISESLKLSVVEPPPTTHRRLRRRRRRPLLAGSLAVGLAVGLVWLLARPEPAAVATAGHEPPGYVGYGAGETAAAASVTITSRPSRALRPAGSFQLAAVVRGAEGDVVPEARVDWTSTDSTVVRVHPENGWVRAMRPGRAHVVAISREGRDSVPITVRRAGVPAPAVTAISITPIPPLRMGDSTILQLATGESSALTWHSTDSSVATVNARTGQVRGVAPGTAAILARNATDSAVTDVTVLPAAVAEVIIQGARPLVVGEELTLTGITTDAQGRVLRDRLIAWMSSDTTILEVDAMTGAISARSPGAVDVTAMSEGGSGRARVTVFARDTAAHAERRGAVDPGILAGVEECHSALLSKDPDRVERLYRPATGSDSENLKKLRRILRTREWAAVVGEREDGEWQLGDETAAMQFRVRLTWKDVSGHRRLSEPVLRAEFDKRQGRWTMASCRIVGTPNL